MDNPQVSSTAYAEQLSTQLRKGFLAYCVLKAVSYEPLYTTDIISQLSSAKLVVVEGTIYPLLSRLRKDGLLDHEWRESEQGPPRKYYRITAYGREVMTGTKTAIDQLSNALNHL